MKKITELDGCFKIPGITKIIRVMKITGLLLMLSVVSVFASKSYSQTKLLNLKADNATVKDVLAKIEDQSEFYFMYSGKVIDADREVSVNIEDQKIDVALDQLFAGTDVDYTIRDRIIVLTTPEVFSPESLVALQQKAVSGTVTDESGQPLPGVTVVVKGTTQGTVTNADGEYQLTGIPEDATLQFSFVGMRTQEVKVENQTSIDVTLAVDAIGIEEVVAVGYGVVKKSDLTGSISSVKGEDIEKVGITSVAHALAGKAAGLNITQTSAQPGGGINWQIRGSATGREPLIILDGFPITSKGEASSGNRYSSGSKAITLNTINPNDIESIEILKDASATAIYGARAAGGVIIITTKRGNEGKVTVDYLGSYSNQRLYNLPEMLSPQDFMRERDKVRKEIFMYENQVTPYGTKTWEEMQGQFSPLYSESYINSFTGGTDWLENVTRPGSLKQNNFSITAGTQTTKYLISLSSYEQDGIVQNNNFKRYTGRINIDQKLKDWLNVGISSSFGTIKENNVPLGGGRNESSGVIRSALQFNPLLDIKDANGDYILDPDQSFIPNPVSLLENKDITKTEDLFVNSYIEAKPVKGLTLKLTAGLNRYWGWRNTFLPTSTLYGQREGGAASRSYNGKNDYLINIMAQYSVNIAEKHSINVLGGYEFQKFLREGFNAANNKFPYDGIKWYNLGLGEKLRPVVGSYGGSSELASYISRINYSYNDKYLLTFNLRVDGSSNFAENNQWGVFPGVSVAWRVYEENFLKNSEVLSNLKLRAGYGQTGNDNISGVLTYYSPGWNYAFGSVSSSGIGLASLGNPNIKWETQTDLNLGIDFGFYNNRISGSIDLYDRVVSDLLGNKPLLSYHAITSIKSNLDAEKQSRGIDFQLNSVNFDTPNFYWGTDITVSYYRDRWRKRDDSWKPDINDEEQEVWGAMWFYLSDGLVEIDEEVSDMPGSFPGTIKLKDINGYLLDGEGNRILDENGKPQYLGEPDGKIDRADLVKLGYNVPIPVGLNNSFKYKNFDLNVFFHAIFNRWAINENKTYYGAESFRVKDGTNMISEIKERWSFDNQSGSFPSVFQAYNPYGHGDYFLEEAWFIRLKNLTLGYSIPSHVLPKGFEKIRMFLDTQNLFVITPYSGMDPETGGGVSYPNQRTFTAGVEIKF